MTCCQMMMLLLPHWLLRCFRHCRYYCLFLPFLPYCYAIALMFLKHRLPPLDYSRPPITVDYYFRLIIPHRFSRDDVISLDHVIITATRLSTFDYLHTADVTTILYLQIAPPPCPAMPCHWLLGIDTLLDKSLLNRGMLYWQAIAIDYYIDRYLYINIDYERLLRWGDYAIDIIFTPLRHYYVISYTLPYCHYADDIYLRLLLIIIGSISLPLLASLIYWLLHYAAITLRWWAIITIIYYAITILHYHYYYLFHYCFTPLLMLPLRLRWYILFIACRFIAAIYHTFTVRHWLLHCLASFI